MSTEEQKEAPKAPAPKAVKEVKPKAPAKKKKAAPAPKEGGEPSVYVEVISLYIDKVLNTKQRVGRVLHVTSERADELVEAKVAKVINYTPPAEAKYKE